MFAIRGQYPACVPAASTFAKHFGRSPAMLRPDEVRAWQLYLIDFRNLARNSLVTTTATLRFFYAVTLKCNIAVDGTVMPKAPRTLPVILSREEVTAFPVSIRSLKHRAILMKAYAGGLRISEVTRLKLSDIDSQRMVLHIEQGTGQIDRHVMLSPRLLEILRSSWKTAGRSTGFSRDGSPTSPSTQRRYGWRADRPVAAPVSASRLRRMCCAMMHSRPIFSNRVPTCAPSSCCWAIAPSLPLRCI